MANGIPAVLLSALAAFAAGFPLAVAAQTTDPAPAEEPAAEPAAQAAAEPADAPARRIGIIFGGAFEDFGVVGPLAGARKTRMAAHYEWDFGVRPYTGAVWEERGMDWDRFYPTALALADDIASRIKPKLVRDHRGVVLYAIVADPDPFLTSAILSPKLRERFRETLGDRIHAVLLERNRFYLFPATGGVLADFGPSLVEEYRRASLPVSLEILLLERDAPRVVGELARETSESPFARDPEEGEGGDR